MRVEHLYRYPVKGLSAEALETADVEEGGPIPWDRAFALAQGDCLFDPGAPAFRPKTEFMCLMKNARIAGLRSAYDPRHDRLTIAAPDGRMVEAQPRTEVGRARITSFLVEFLGEEARGQPVFQYVQGHAFHDQRLPVISLLNLASVHALERVVGAKRDRMRFRANVYFTADAAFREFEWVGRMVQIGGATLRVVRRTTRCPATQVNPATAERDADPPAELRAAFGHADLGVHAIVVEAGRIAPGDAVVPLDE
jgi:hypothetical protein